MNSFHLKAFNALDLEKRFIETVRHFKSNPLSKVWVIVPQLFHQTHWKKILDDHAISLLNLHFTTPSQLRQKLPPLLGFQPPLPLNREAMRFILEKSCEPLIESSPLFHPLSRDARPLLRTLDEIENAGSPIQTIEEIPELLPWFKIWESIPLGKWGRANQDQAILKAAQSVSQRLPDGCLWLGLQRQDLAFAPLLQSTSLLFDRIAAIHLVPELAEESVQQIWLQRVDEWLPHAQESLPNESNDFTPEEPSPSAQFFCAPSLRRETDLILSLIQNALHSAPPGEKIGVILPSASPLGITLSLELEKAHIPFYSTWTEPSLSKATDLALLSLIQIQIDEIKSPDFIHFLEAHRDQPLLWKILEATPDQIPKIQNHLYLAFQKTLSPYLDEAPAHPLLLHFKNFFKSDLGYPERFTISTGIAITCQQIEKLCGREASIPLQEYLEESLLDLDSVWKKPLSTHEYLTLLQRLLQTPEHPPTGDPWAPVWILKPEEATPLTWHTLILSQMNENFWPSLQESGASLLNDSLRLQLNQRLAPNPQFQPLITLTSRFQIERARFDTLLQSIRSTLIFTASATSELEGGDELFPSEFYRHAWNLYHSDHPWKESYWNQLVIQSPPLSDRDTPSPFDPIFLPLLERFNPNTPFNSYFFCDETHPLPPRPLSATNAEKILKDPAYAWFEIHLQVKPFPITWKSRDLLSLIQGSQLHEWISHSFKTIAGDAEFNPLPSWKSWHDALRHTLDQAQQKIRQTPHAPLWWKQHFPALEWRAQKLLENLYQTLAQLPDAHLACEYRPRRPMIQPLPEFSAEQEWIGRIDWIALNAEKWEDSKKVWVLDLKTGSGSAPFQVSTLLKKAEYFQLLVYAALVEAQHPLHPEISLGVILPKWAPPVEMTPLSAFSPEFRPLWEKLSNAWTRGIYGQAQEINQRFSTIQSLPLATTPIPQEILNLKQINKKLPEQ